MPRYDGTGPRGLGPMTGKGGGYCVMRLPESPHEPALGFVGLSGRPVRLAPGSRRFGAMLLEAEVERIRSVLLAIEQDLRDLEAAAQRLGVLNTGDMSDDQPAHSEGGAM